MIFFILITCLLVMHWYNNENLYFDHSLDLQQLTGLFTEFYYDALEKEAKLDYTFGSHLDSIYQVEKRK